MPDIREIVDELEPAARAFSESAYSPYSKVKVGAVVRANDGRVFGGCNMENASYGLTQCAERNAIASAVVSGIQPGELQTLLVYSNGFDSLSPCGACRQVMSELMARDALVVSCSEAEQPRHWTMLQLLPDPFVLE